MAKQTDRQTAWESKKIWRNVRLLGHLYTSSSSPGISFVPEACWSRQWGPRQGQTVERSHQFRKYIYCSSSQRLEWLPDWLTHWQRMRCPELRGYVTPSVRNRMEQKSCVCNDISSMVIWLTSYAENRTLYFSDDGTMIDFTIRSRCNLKYVLDTACETPLLRPWKKYLNR
jgi:hypothetical protein